MLWICFLSFVFGSMIISTMGEREEKIKAFKEGMDVPTDITPVCPYDNEMSRCWWDGVSFSRTGDIQYLVDL